MRWSLFRSVEMTQRAVLLAAGRGTRLGTSGEETPKCLLRINGREILDCQLEALAGAGIEDVTVVAGFMAEAVMRHVANRCRVIVNEQYATTDSITSLALAAPYLHGHGFLLQNGDTLYPVDLIRRLQAAPRENACLVDSVRPHRAGEYHVEVADGRVVKYSNALPPERSVGESAQLLRVGAADSAAFLDRIAKSDIVQRLERISQPGLRRADERPAGSGPSSQRDCPGGKSTPPKTWRDVTPRTWQHPKQLRSSPAPPSPRKRLTAARVGRFVKSLPWRFRWLPPTIRPLFRHPVLVTRKLQAFRAGQLSLRWIGPGRQRRTAFFGWRIRRREHSASSPFSSGARCSAASGMAGSSRAIKTSTWASWLADAARLPEFRQRLMRRGFGVRMENDDKLSLVHPRHPNLFIDIDVVRPHRDGWAITNKHSDPRKMFRYHFPAGTFSPAHKRRYLPST